MFFSTNAKVGKQAVLADKIVVDVGSKVFPLLRYIKVVSRSIYAPKGRSDDRIEQTRR